MSTVNKPFVFNPLTHPVDSGWVAYMSKEFDDNPAWRRKAVHKVAASKDTKAMATKISKNRPKEKEALVRWMHEDKIEN